MALSPSGKPAETKLSSDGGKMFRNFLVNFCMIHESSFDGKPRILLQVCKIVEGQRYSKRLNERQITNLLKVTCQRPRDRELDIIQVIQLLV